MSAILTIAGYALREALRRKVFAVVLLLTAGFLFLYWLANHYLFRDVDNLGSPSPAIEPRTFAGAFMVGLAMFSTLFLGVVLAIFLTLGAVRGDAERGLLQPLLVRPVSRPTLLLARWLGAIAVSTPYVIAVYATAVVITGLTGDWWPDHAVVPAIELAGGVAIVAALSLLGSVFLTATANGIAIFMLFGAGLVSGLLGSIGHALNSRPARALGDDRRVGRAVRGALPGRAARDHRRHDRLDGYLIQLGPFGGANTGGTPVRLWACAYLLVVGLIAAFAFSGATSDHQALCRRLLANATRFFFSSERRRASCFAASRRSSRCSAR